MSASSSSGSTPPQHVRVTPLGGSQPDLTGPQSVRVTPLNSQTGQSIPSYSMPFSGGSNTLPNNIQNASQGGYPFEIEFTEANVAVIRVDFLGRTWRGTLKNVTAEQLRNDANLILRVQTIVQGALYDLESNFRPDEYSKVTLRGIGQGKVFLDHKIQAPTRIMDSSVQGWHEEYVPTQVGREMDMKPITPGSWQRAMALQEEEYPLNDEEAQELEYYGQMATTQEYYQTFKEAISSGGMGPLSQDSWSNPHFMPHAPPLGSQYYGAPPPHGMPPQYGMQQGMYPPPQPGRAYPVQQQDLDGYNRELNQKNVSIPFGDEQIDMIDLLLPYIATKLSLADLEGQQKFLDDLESLKTILEQGGLSREEKVKLCTVFYNNLHQVYADPNCKDTSPRQVILEQVKDYLISCLSEEDGKEDLRETLAQFGMDNIQTIGKMSKQDELGMGQFLKNISERTEINDLVQEQRREARFYEQQRQAQWPQQPMSPPLQSPATLSEDFEQPQSFGPPPTMQRPQPQLLPDQLEQRNLAYQQQRYQRQQQQKPEAPPLLQQPPPPAPPPEKSLPEVVQGYQQDLQGYENQGFPVAILNFPSQDLKLKTDANARAAFLENLDLLKGTLSRLPVQDKMKLCHVVFHNLYTYLEGNKELSEDEKRFIYWNMRENLLQCVPAENRYDLNMMFVKYPALPEPQLSTSISSEMREFLFAIKKTK